MFREEKKDLSKRILIIQKIWKIIWTLYVYNQKAAKIDDDVIAKTYEVRMNEEDVPDKFW